MEFGALDLRRRNSIRNNIRGTGRVRVGGILRHNVCVCLWRRDNWLLSEINMCLVDMCVRWCGL